MSCSDWQVKISMNHPGNNPNGYSYWGKKSSKCIKVLIKIQDKIAMQIHQKTEFKVLSRFELMNYVSSLLWWKGEQGFLKIFFKARVTHPLLSNSLRIISMCLSTNENNWCSYLFQCHLCHLHHNFS